ncbi:MAG: PEGA domain-containing protein [Gammaproteobacteria bacterium]|jgi:hypothetical protein
MRKILTQARSNIALLIASMAILLTAGCATLFTGTTDTIKFSSNVDPVRVYIGGRFVGKTPLTTTVKREIGQGPRVKFEKEGYGTQEFYLEKEFNWVSVLDISSVVTSGGIDVLTGAVVKYSKHSYHVEMIHSSRTSLIDRQRQIKFANFVLLNADRIRTDLARDGGEYAHSLVSLAVANETNSNEFETWLLNQKRSLISASNPESLLKELRQSHMTP